VRKLHRWRGLAQLVDSAVESASLAIERIQKETADRPFGILEQIPEVADVAGAVHVVYDLGVSSTHVVIRGVTRVSVCAIVASLEAFAPAPEDEDRAAD
jgi:hypothetical protein